MIAPLWTSGIADALELINPTASARNVNFFKLVSSSTGLAPQPQGNPESIY
jgi:hypothetical protein